MKRIRYTNHDIFDNLSTTKSSEKILKCVILQIGVREMETHEIGVSKRKNEGRKTKRVIDNVNVIEKENVPLASWPVSLCSGTGPTIT